MNTLYEHIVGIRWRKVFTLCFRNTILSKVKWSFTAGLPPFLIY